MKEAKSLFAFGSERHSRNLFAQLDSGGSSKSHISEEANGNASRSASPEVIAARFIGTLRLAGPPRACVAFGRAKVAGGIENIAKAWEIVRQGPLGSPETLWVGPSVLAAGIFSNKLKMASALNRLGVPVARTNRVDSASLRRVASDLRDGRFPCPAVLKATALSGGRGMRLIAGPTDLDAAFRELTSFGLNQFALVEYIQGVEASFGILKLGSESVRFPTCYKGPTDLRLTHPDSKVKLAGLFRDLNEPYVHLERLAEAYGIQGPFSMEAILTRDHAGLLRARFIDAATRISGSTPIRSASLAGFNLYRCLAGWIDHGVVERGAGRTACIQYARFCNPGPEVLAKLASLPWVLETRVEHLGDLPISEDHRSRLRISFVAGTVEDGLRRAAEIGRVVGDSTSADDIRCAIDWHAASYPELIGWESPGAKSVF